MEGKRDSKPFSYNLVEFSISSDGVGSMHAFNDLLVDYEGKFSMVTMATALDHLRLRSKCHLRSVGLQNMDILFI